MWLRQPLPPPTREQAAWSHALCSSPPRGAHFRGEDPGRAWGCLFHTLGDTSDCSPEAAPQPSVLGPWGGTDPHSQPRCLPLTWARAGCSLSASNANDPEEGDCIRVSETGWVSGHTFLQAAFDEAHVIKHIGPEGLLWAGAWPGGTHKDQDGGGTV